MITSRFAPSPTGYIHVGNARTALINWLFVRKNQGKFILRIDDTDKVRSKAEYVDHIKYDLEWLGLHWDGYFHQSQRIERYQEVKQQLINDGRLYACYETPQELEIKRKILLSQGKPPIYDRAGLTITEEQKQRFTSEGRKPHYRFRLDLETNIEWIDLVRQHLSFDPNNLSDPILIREDGSMTYMLCSVVDDVDYDITHVMRGEDHVSNTAIGIQLTQAIKGRLPQFAHISLLKAKDAQISKRDGGFEIKALREEFIESMTINSLLCYLGSSQQMEAARNLQDLINSFDFNHYGKAPALYDPEDLVRLNHKFLYSAHYNDVKENIGRLEFAVGQDFYEAIKANLNKVDEIEQWHNICYEPVKPIVDNADAGFLKDSCKFLPTNQWDTTTWTQWTNKLKEAFNRKGKDLFLPIRRALTGQDHGPELQILLPLIGREKATKRLNGIEA
jgi:glutamyl-tRNA synthetase